MFVVLTIEGLNFSTFIHNVVYKCVCAEVSVVHVGVAWFQDSRSGWRCSGVLIGLCMSPLKPDGFDGDAAERRSVL